MVKFDLVTGAATPLQRFGELSSKLTLLDSDGTTVLASNSAEFTDYVPFGASYSLGVSVLGGTIPLIFSDSFEGVPD